MGDDIENVMPLQPVDTAPIMSKSPTDMVDTVTVGEPRAERDNYPDLSKARGIFLVAALSSAGFLTVLNVQSVLIMLPSIGAAVGIPAQRQQLVVSIYNIASGCLMLLWGRLADVCGRRLVFMLGSLIFTLSTLCLPFCLSEVPFYVLRVLQGLSGSSMIPSAIGIIATTFPPGPSRNRAYVAASAVASLGSVLGSLAGGLIGSFLDWRWVFWIPGIIAALATIATFLATSSSSIRANARPSVPPRKVDAFLEIDWIGAGLVSISLIVLLISLTEGDSLGWHVAWVPALIVVSVLMLAVFTCWQYHLEKHSKPQPLMRISMFRNTQFSALFILVGCFYAAFNSFLVFATFFYQDYLELDVLDTTLRFLPSGIAGLIVSFAMPPALSRIPGFCILEFGLLCGLISPLLFAIPTISPRASYWAWSFPAMCLCCSVEIVWPVVGLLIAKRLPQEDQALGSGLLQTVNNVGRSLGLAVGTAVQLAVQGDIGLEGQMLKHEDVLLGGLRAAQWTNTGSAAIAALLGAIFFHRLGRT